MSALKPLSDGESEAKEAWLGYHLSAASRLEESQLWVLEVQPYDDSSADDRNVEKTHQSASLEEVGSKVSSTQSRQNSKKGAAVPDHRHQSHKIETRPPTSLTAKKILVGDREAFRPNSKRMTNQRSHPKKRHICDQCGRAFQYPSELIRHQFVHLRQAAARRILCQSEVNSPSPSMFDLSLRTENTFANSCETFIPNRTRNQHTYPKKQHICDQCEKTFRWPSDLTRHHQRVHSQRKAVIQTVTRNTTNQRSQPKKQHICDQCGRAFRYPSDLIRHQSVHLSGEAVKRILCQSEANSLSPSMPDLSLRTENTFANSCETFIPNRTTNQHTYPKKQHICDQCEKIFRWPSDLTRHHQRVHSRGKAVVQTVTPNTTNQLSHPKKHICDQCGRAFRYPSELIRHQFVHLSRSAARWILCQSEANSPRPSMPDLSLGTENTFANSCETFIPNRTRNQHTYPKKQHICDQCEKTFRWPSDLTRHHQRVHSRGKAVVQTVTRNTTNQRSHPKKQHICDQCEKTFRWPSDLTRHHQRVHSRGKAVVQTVTRNTTNQRSHPKKRHICDQCGKAFRYPSEIIRHQSVHLRGAAARRILCQSEANSLSPSMPDLSLRTENTFANSCETFTPNRTRNQHTYPKKQHICDQCEKTFRWPSDLTRHHQRVHSRGKAVVQTVTPNTTNQRSHPKGTHFRKSFICGQCGKYFLWFSDLTRHESTHSRQKEVKRKKFQSETCSSSISISKFLKKDFGMCSDLAQDDYAQSGLQPYYCAICGCQFKRYVQLARHQKDHEENYEGEEKGACQRVQNIWREDATGESIHMEQQFCSLQGTSKSCQPVAANPKICECGVCDIETSSNSELLSPNSNGEMWACPVTPNISLLSPGEWGHHDRDQEGESSVRLQRTEPSPSKVDAQGSAELVSAGGSGETVTTTLSMVLTASPEAHRSTESLMSKEASTVTSDVICTILPSAVVNQNPEGPFSLKNPNGLIEQASPLMEANKPHACPSCGKQFSLVSYLTKHLRIHQVGKPHRCIVCGKCFAQISYLAKHQRIHTAGPEHICEDCGKVFTQITYLNKHRRCHKSSNWTPSQNTKPCPSLPQLASVSDLGCSDLAQDDYAQSGLRPYYCAICGCQFKRYVQLARHQKDHEENYEGEEKGACQRVQNIWREDATGESIHMEQQFCFLQGTSKSCQPVAANPKICECGVCDIETSSNSELLSPNSNGEIGVTGQAHNISLLSPGEWGHHDRDQEGESSVRLQRTEPSPPKVDAQGSAELVSAGGSGETVTTTLSMVLTASPEAHWSSESLMSEEASTVTSDVICTILPSAVVNQNPEGPFSLKNPNGLIEQASPLMEANKPHACPSCGKQFSLVSYLTKHLRIHQVGKPHRCIVCGKCFAQISYLAKHQRIHTAGPEHICEDCGKVFTQISYLNKHRRCHKSSNWTPSQNTKPCPSLPQLASVSDLGRTINGMQVISYII